MCLQLVGLSPRLGRVTGVRRRRVEGEGRRGGDGVLGAAGLQSVSHCGRRLQRLGRQFGLSGPDDGRWDWRDPAQAITFLPQLSGRTNRGSVTTAATNGVAQVGGEGEGGKRFSMWTRRDDGGRAQVPVPSLWLRPSAAIAR